MKRLTSGPGWSRLSNFTRGQLAVRAIGAVPPPPPGPPGPPKWIPQAHQVQPELHRHAGPAGGDGFIPAPPPVSALPRQDASFPAEVATGASENRLLSSQEKYQQMLQRLHLPLTKEPNTPRPNAEDLIEGFRLRVKWSDGWWKARVLETRDDQIKVHFDTWGAEHDEWISRDSQRLRLPLPDDRPAEEEDSKSFVSAHVRDRAYVPKPFNPEKEFQKRQLRIREKVAAMQKTKIGFVDPQLTAKLGAQAGEAASTPTPVSLESAEFESKKSKLKEEAHVSPEVAALNVKAAEEVLAQAEAPLPPPLDTTLKPQEPDVPPPDVEETVQPEPSRDPVSPAREAQATPPKTEAANAVRWEELLSDKKERYYHEVATGRTQWELPSEGWVALLDDDGSKYYWNTEMGTTQWDPPL